MPLTEFDQGAALILVDLQKGLLSSAHADIPDVLGNAAELVRGFRGSGHPVVFVSVSGRAPGRTDLEPTGARALAHPADWSELIPDLGRHEDDVHITKHRWGAFHDTELHDVLQARHVTQVFIGGVATSMGVESTARSAHEHGYHVVLVTDAMLDSDPVSHTHSIAKIFPLIGQTTTTAEVLSAL